MDDNDNKRPLLDPEKKQLMSEARIQKNVLAVSCCFLLIFSAFGGLSRLQSSLHNEQGLGVTTTSILYICTAFSSLILPKLAATYFGTKHCISLSLLTYVAWTLSNGHATWWTMVPTSTLLGLGTSILWTSASTYITALGELYALQSGIPTETALTRMFSMFYFFFQMGNAIGSAISSLILAQDRLNTTVVADNPGPATHFCGVQFCPWNSQSDSNTPVSSTKVWTLVGVYSALGITSVVISIAFVDSLEHALGKETHRHTWHELSQDVTATLRCLKNKNLLLILPLTTYGGLLNTFVTAEWSQSFVTCALGVSMVGWTIMITSLSAAAMCFFTGFMAKNIKRVFIFGLAFTVDLIAQYILRVWSPSAASTWLFFVISATYGMVGAARETQLNVLYGILLPGEIEAAFSNHKLWRSVGMAISFAYSFYVCTSVKLYIQNVLFFCGIFGYAVIEIMIYKQEHRTVERG